MESFYYLTKILKNPWPSVCDLYLKPHGLSSRAITANTPVYGPENVFPFFTGSLLLVGMIRDEEDQKSQH